VARVCTLAYPEVWSQKLDEFRIEYDGSYLTYPNNSFVSINRQTRNVHKLQLGFDFYK